jgi:hypothetical protein
VSAQPTGIDPHRHLAPRAWPSSRRSRKVRRRDWAALTHRAVLPCDLRRGHKCTDGVGQQELAGLERRGGVRSAARLVQPVAVGQQRAVGQICGTRLEPPAFTGVFSALMSLTLQPLTETNGARVRSRRRGDITCFFPGDAATQAVLRGLAG